MSRRRTMMLLEFEPLEAARARLIARVSVGDDLGPVRWRGACSFDPEAVARELDALHAARAAASSGHGPGDALREHGQLVFDLLLPPPVKQSLRTEPIDALMVVGAPGERAVPWALLHDGQGFLGRRFALGEGRTVDRWPALPVERPPHTLIIADPAADLPAARVEGEALGAVFAEAPDPSPYDLRLGRLTRGDMLRVLRRYTVVHYAGHVDPPGAERPPGWRLADGALEADAVAALAGGPMPRLVVANACRSAGPVGEALLAAGVRHLVGCDVDLPDLQGADFARDLHRALVGGHPVGEALRRARALAAERGDPAWMAYRLRGDPRTRFARPGVAEGRTELRRAIAMAVRRPPRGEGLEARVAERRAWRRRLERLVAPAGGVRVPGEGLVERVVFGLPRREDDALGAARAALRVLEAAPDAVVTLDGGRLALTAAGPAGGPLDAVEARCWALGPGVHPGAEIHRALGSAGRFAEDGRLLAVLRRAPSGGPFVGRSAELDRIGALAAAGAGAAVIVGPAGIGKSRLITVAAARLGPAFTVVRTAEGAGGPFGGVAEMVRILCGLDGRETTGGARARIEETLSLGARPGDFLSIDDLLDDVDDTRSRQADVIEAMLGGEVDGRVEPTVPPAVRALVEAAATRGPLALFLEDAHLMSRPARAVVDGLLVDPPALIVLSARPGVAIDRPGCARIELGPLPPRAARALISALRADLDDDGVRRVEARAEGNPLFLHGLARCPADGPLPESIEAVIQARIDRESPDDRALLQAAAVLGRTFWTAGVERLVGRPVGADLDRLADARLVVPEPRSILPGQSQWRFEHGLLHAVIEQGLPGARRAALHGRAALWLDDEVTGPRASRAANIARHREAAGDLRRAIDDWIAAADHAEASLAPDEARRALSLAAELCDRLAEEGRRVPAVERAALRARLGEFDRLAGDFDAAAERFAAAIAETAPGPDRAWRSSRLAAIELARGRPEAARAAAWAALADVDADTPPAVRADVQHRAAWIECRESDLSGARARLEALLDTLPEGERRGRAMAWRLLGTIAHQQGDAERAHQWLRRALTVADDDDETVRVLHGLALVAVQRGAYDEAAAHYARTVRIRARRGDRAGLAKTYGNLGALYGERGDYARAERYLEEAIRIRARIGHASLAISHANLADVYLRWQKLDAAAGQLERVHALLDAGDAPSWAESELWRIIADVALRRGRLGAASDAAERAIAVARRMGDRLRQASGMELRARIVAAAGDVAGAVPVFEAAIEIYEDLEATGPLCPALERFAALVEAHDPARARRLRRTRTILLELADGG